MSSPPAEKRMRLQPEATPPSNPLIRKCGELSISPPRYYTNGQRTGMMTLKEIEIDDKPNNRKRKSIVFPINSGDEHESEIESKIDKK